MIRVPASVIVAEDQIRYCYRVQERLRLWHNEVGARTQLAPDAKEYLPLKSFRAWQREVWTPKSKSVYGTLHSLRKFHELHAENPLERAAGIKLASSLSLSDKETAAIAVRTMRDALKIDGKSASVFDCFFVVEKLPGVGVLEQLEDPLEDFTTFTEVDTGSKITVTATKVNASVRYDDPEANYMVYKDKGTGFFPSTGFTHQLEVFETWYPAGKAATFPWAITNTGGTGYSGWSAPAPYLNWSKDVNPLTFYLGNKVDTNDSTGILSGNTNYYLTVVLDPNVGAHGTIYVYIYSNASRTTLVDTLAQAQGSAPGWRYIYAFAKVYYPSSFLRSGYCQNLDLGVPSIAAAVLAEHHYFTRRA